MLKAVVDQNEFDSLPEAVRGFYRDASDEDGVEGKILDVEGVNGVEIRNVSKHDKALSQERSARRALEQKIRSFDGLDPEAARDALTRIEEMKDWKPGEEVERRLESRVKDMRAEFDTALKSRDEENSALERQLSDMLLASEARDALSGLDLVDHGADILMPHVRSACRIERDADGKRSVVIVDSNGDVRASSSNPSQNMTVSEYVQKHLATDKRFSPLLKPKSSGGTPDPRRGGRGVGTNKTVDDDKMTGEQRLTRAIRANG